MRPFTLNTTYDSASELAGTMQTDGELASGSKSRDIGVNDYNKAQGGPRLPRLPREYGIANGK